MNSYRTSSLGKKFLKRNILNIGMLNLALLTLVPASAYAQFGAPPAADPSVMENLLKGEKSKPTPRTASGHPNLTGHWAAPGSGGGGSPFGGGGGPLAADETGTITVFPAFVSSAVVNAGDVASVNGRRENKSLRPRYKAEYQAQADAYFESGNLDDPTFSCGLPGVPRIGIPTEIVQTDDAVFLLYENLVNHFRIVPTDGTEHDPDLDSVPNGDAIGYWDGDTLVIDIVNIDEDTWLDGDGSYHSDTFHVTERFTREGNVLSYEVTSEDSYFAEPFKSMMSYRVLSQAGTHIGQEWPCVEESIGHQVNGTKH